jgi:hypothetical protein
MFHTTLDHYTVANRIAFYHATCFPPVLSTWCTAIDAGHFTTWPGFTSGAVRKHPPPSMAMHKGHLDQTRMNARTTQRRATPTPPPQTKPPNNKPWNKRPHMTQPLLNPHQPVRVTYTRTDMPPPACYLPTLPVDFSPPALPEINTSSSYTNTAATSSTPNLWSTAKAPPLSQHTNKQFPYSNPVDSNRFSNGSTMKHPLLFIPSWTTMALPSNYPRRAAAVETPPNVPSTPLKITSSPASVPPTVIFLLTCGTNCFRSAS